MIHPDPPPEVEVVAPTPPLPVARDPPPADLDEIRERVTELAESEAMDKANALTVTRLFHAMEALLQHEKHVRLREEQRLRAELERTHMTVELDRLARKRTLEDQALLAAPPPSARRFSGK